MFEHFTGSLGFFPSITIRMRRVCCNLWKKKSSFLRNRRQRNSKSGSVTNYRLKRVLWRFITGLLLILPTWMDSYFDSLP
jgi:hypothetical protein